MFARVKKALSVVVLKKIFSNFFAEMFVGMKKSPYLCTRKREKEAS